MDLVVLVDKNNRETGIEEKLKAHRKGKLHRAFSIFVFNSKGELLIQQRAKEKYHCGGLWANTCCSHPRPNEDYFEATLRRLQEEMGFKCELQEEFSFVYRKKFKNGFTEHEHDTVFTGLYDGEVAPDPEEVMDYKWVSMKNLEQDITRNPKKYAFWFKVALKNLITGQKHL